MARAIAREAMERPDRFAALARDHSEDEVTRASGGSLGGVTASHLRFDPAVLDALAVIRPGQVYEVVESRHGFHVLLRREPPPQKDVAGRRIVIGYDDAGYLEGQVRPDRERPKRSRSEALALAESVAAKLRGGEPFEALLDRHSDYDDGGAGGDIGLFSNRAPGELPREREALARLHVGAVSEPIDAAIGVQVYERTDASPRPEYAMSAIRLRYDRAAPEGDRTSHASVRRKAESIALVLASEPGRFEAFQKEHCCPEPTRWTRGRQPAALTRAVETLPMGGISGPVDLGFEIVILKRLDPKDLPPERAVLFELPSPASPDVMAIAKLASGPGVQKLVVQIGEDAARELSLDERRAAECRKIHEALAAVFDRAVGVEERERALSLRAAEIRALLTEDEHARYQARLAETVKSRLLRR